MLKGSAQTELDILKLESQPVIIEPMRRGMAAEREFPVDHHHRTAVASSNRSQGNSGVRLPCSDHHRHAGFNDAALFRGDRRNYVAQVFHVIEANWGYHAKHRPHHSGGIQSSADHRVLYRNIET